MTDQDCCLIVLAKEPVSGQVKKRLSAEVGQENAAALYKAFLKDTYTLADFLPVHFRILAYESFGGIPKYLYSTFPHFVFYPQHGEDSGARIQDTVMYARHLGAERIVIIGSDSPTLPSALISESFERLKKTDIILGPSRDGGIYLLGIKRLEPDILKELPWGTDKVSERIKENAAAAGCSLYEMCTWYDIDQLTDLKQLRRQGPSSRARATSALFEEMEKEITKD